MAVNDQYSLACYHDSLFKTIPQILGTIIMSKI